MLGRANREATPPVEESAPSDFFSSWADMMMLVLVLVIVVLVLVLLVVLLLEIRRVDRTAKSGEATAKATIVSAAAWLATEASSQARGWVVDELKVDDDVAR